MERSRPSDIAINPNNSPQIADVAPTAAYTENATGTFLAPALTVSAPDGTTTLASATVTITAGYVFGDELSANGAGTSITASYNAANRLLVLSGTDSLAHYQQVLRSVQYASSSDSPTTYGANFTRTITWQVNDGAQPVALFPEPYSSFSTAASPQSVAIGDLNGDGRLDLTTANNSIPSTVSVLLGNGDGTFQPKQDFRTGVAPHSVAIGDLNGDGRLDLTTANYFSSNVSVLLGNGDGTFQPQQGFGVGFTPMSVAIGDLNGDGRLDLTTANYTFPSTVSVLLGNGDGTFQPKQDFSAGSNPYSVAIGDLNGDGRLDITTTNSGSDSVSVLLGNGDGTFQPQQGFGVGSFPKTVAIGDLNGDGRLDLTTANYNSNTVSVLLGNGDGTFEPKQDFGIVSSPTSVAIGDLNGDGRLDLTTANLVASTVSVLLNAATNLSATQHTTITVTAVNDAPTLANTIVDPPGAEINDPYSFTVNANTFADDSILTYSAMLDNGSPLPAFEITGKAPSVWEKELGPNWMDLMPGEFQTGLAVVRRKAARNCELLNLDEVDGYFRHFNAAFKRSAAPVKELLQELHALPPVALAVLLEAG